MYKYFYSLLFIFVSSIAVAPLFSEETGNAPHPDSVLPLESPTESIELSSPSPAPPSELTTPSPSPFSATPISPDPTPVPVIPKQEVSGGFTRYIPDHNGDMEWKLAGTTVKFLSPTCLEIMEMKADSLSAKIGYLSLTAEKVLYDTENGRAEADEDRITVRRENMVLTGKGFLWIPDLKQIRVYEDVNVLIKEKGNVGLFPL